MKRPLIACVGGFLGAGKTTALGAAARELLARGARVGIVTNDQGSRLVDTEVMVAAGLPTEEVAGGCFCCRFDELLAHAEEILEREDVDVILAEAVGSCTDLAATVLRPLQRYYGDRFDVAPLSVLVDPDRLRSFAAGASGFPGTVDYLFEMQLAEADVLVLNKTDLLGADERAELVASLKSRFPEAVVESMSASSGDRVPAWVDTLLALASAGGRIQHVDYETYAAAEAALGWLNATVDVQADVEMDPKGLVEDLMLAIRDRVAGETSAIAHVKILVATVEGSDRLALTENDGTPHWSVGGALGASRALSLIVNARVGSDPEALERAVRGALDDSIARAGIRFDVQHLECFSPPPPRPTHHLADLEDDPSRSATP